MNQSQQLELVWPNGVLRQDDDSTTGSSSDNLVIPTTAPAENNLPSWNRVNTPSFVSNFLHTGTEYSVLDFATPLRQSQRVCTSPPLRTLDYPYVGQFRNLQPFSATSDPFSVWGESTPLPQGHHSQSQELIHSSLSFPLLHTDISFSPLREVATRGFFPELVNESVRQVASRLTSDAPRIELESPLPRAGESTVRVRRDTCVSLSFDIHRLSRGSTTYDGLKIPSTPSVRNLGSEGGMRLLSLRIRVLGATTGTPYETLCLPCKDREGNRHAFPDFRARSNILVPQKYGRNTRVLVAFTLACCSKHRMPSDSEYCLEVILTENADQPDPVIQYVLPYSFDVVTKLPPRIRYQAEDETAPVAVDQRPNKASKKVTGRASCVRSVVPQSASRSDEGQLSAGDFRGSINSRPPRTSSPPMSPADDHLLISPTEATIPSRPSVPLDRDEGIADGRDPVLEGINPNKGPISGGIDIWIEGSNIPTGLTPLYARFGDNFSRVIVRKPNLLSCPLPPANIPGTTIVILSRSPDPDAPALGKSLCSFNYFTGPNDMTFRDEVPTHPLRREPATQSNIPLARPLVGNNGNAPTNSEEVPSSEITPTGPEVITLGVTILTPRFEHGRFPYREHVTSRVYLSGKTPLPFDGIVLDPVLPNESSLVLKCYAECRTCAGQTSSPNQQCNPIGFYLEPVQDLKHNQGFTLDNSSGTLTGNATFKIKCRPRMPKAGDQKWRCSSESLVLTYSVSDHVGNNIAQKNVEAPFQARGHSKKGGS